MSVCMILSLDRDKNEAEFPGRTDLFKILCASVSLCVGHQI